MDSYDLLSIQQLLDRDDIVSCFVGEIALNYYNVPRAIHDIEICVTASDLPAASALLLREDVTGDQLIAFTAHPWPRGSRNVFTDYKSSYPRLRCTRSANRAAVGSFLCILPDTSLGLKPLTTNIVRKKAHDCQDVQYSAQLQDLIKVPSHIASLRIPRLDVWLRGYLAAYAQSDGSDYVAAMVAESLIDGMDLDEQWLTAHSTRWSETDIRVAHQLISAKPDRLDYLTSNSPSCYVQDVAAQKLVRCIPGRDNRVE